MNTIKVLNESGIEFLASNIDVKHVPNKDVYILNYRQILSNCIYDKFHPVIRECRNLIVRNTATGWVVMSKSFERFFNYNECKDYVFTKGTIAYEKLDGSLIQVTYFDNQWHIFTRGSDADTNPFRGLDTFSSDTFGSHVRKFISEEELNPDYVYIFELCTPEAHITIYEKEKLVLLTVLVRSDNFNELDDPIQNSIALQNKWDSPKVFYPSSMEEVFDRLSKEPKDFEGYVLRNGSSRVKVKSESYLMLHHLGTNSKNDLIKIVVMGEIDEASVILKKYDTQPIKSYLEGQYSLLEKFYDENKDLPRKEFALKLRELNTPLQWILFDIKSGKYKQIRCIWSDAAPLEKNKLINRIVTSIESFI